MGANTVIKDVGFLPEEEWNELNKKELPSVTSSDNGKVLTVQSGKWKAVEPTGGGSVEPLVCLYDDNESQLDTTFGAIKSAIDSGQSVLYKGNVYGNSYEIWIITSYTVYENEGIWYGSIVFSGGTFVTNEYESFNAMASDYPHFAD